MKNILIAVQPEGRNSFLERLSALGFSHSSVQVLNIISIYLSTKDIPEISAFCRPLHCEKSLSFCIYRTRQKASSTITHTCTVVPAGLQTAVSEALCKIVLTLFYYYLLSLLLEIIIIKNTGCQMTEALGVW